MFNIHKSVKTSIQHLAWYAVSTPFFTVISFIIFEFSNMHDLSEKAIGEWFGYLLLVTSGIFLYIVFIFILPSVYNKHDEKRTDRLIFAMWLDSVILIAGLVSVYLLNKIKV